MQAPTYFRDLTIGARFTLTSNPGFTYAKHSDGGRRCGGYAVFLTTPPELADLVGKTCSVPSNRKVQVITTNP